MDPPELVNPDQTTTSYHPTLAAYSPEEEYVHEEADTQNPLSQPAPVTPAAYQPATQSLPPTYPPWNHPTPTHAHVRQRSGSSGASQLLQQPLDHSVPVTIPVTTNDPFHHPQRPSGPARTPSGTYNPPRTPAQFAPQTPLPSHNAASLSTNLAAASRRDPNAQYRAQEEAYVRRVRQGPNEWLGRDGRNKSLFNANQNPYSDVDPDEESPAAEDSQYDSDEPDVQQVLEHARAPLAKRELENPRNRERLEWHMMLESVLKGDVVKQEMKRLIRGKEDGNVDVLKSDIWTGVRAKALGRSVPFQRRLTKHGRTWINRLIEEVISFEIKGESEAGKPPLQQVEDVVMKIEECEALYPTVRELKRCNPRANSDEFRESCAAVVSWHNTTMLINTQLSILKRWVGNEELDFVKPLQIVSQGGEVSEEGSFLERILKESDLNTLQSTDSMLSGISAVIDKAKNSLIANADAFARRHLPPYIEELLTLINFPSRLIQEVIRLRVSYGKKMKDPTKLTSDLLDPMISQISKLLEVAVHIKQRYLVVSQHEPGWDPPPCVDENFDSAVVDCLKYYFKLLNRKLTQNKNTFKEAEIIEQEWEFLNEIGRELENGDIEVAEQFSSLTAKALQRLMVNFDKDLIIRPEESYEDIGRRFKTVLDSVRVRQRKLFRFSRILRHRFENATEYNTREEIADTLADTLAASDHFLVTTSEDVSGQKGVYLVASPTLYDNPKAIQSILGTSFRSDVSMPDHSNSYVLAIKPEKPFVWTGRKLVVEDLEFPADVRHGKLRLVAIGSQQHLQNARAALAQSTGLNLDVAIEQRANLNRVNIELNKIRKTASKLSNTILASVDVIKKQNNCRENHELVQSFFQFAAEFGKRFLMFVDPSRRPMNYDRLVRVSLDWVSFVCDECDASDKKTFKWAVSALEFAMMMTHGHSILTIKPEHYLAFRQKVGGCMSILISHFDIMGARSSMAARAKDKSDASKGLYKNMDLTLATTDPDAAKAVQEQREKAIQVVDQRRADKPSNRQTLGRVLDHADRTVSVLSSSATNISLRWHQSKYIGGGTSGSVYLAITLDTSHLLAVKEIRLQDSTAMPTVAQQIRDEMTALESLDHPNIVSYHGIEVHRDKVYIFMEYCSGGSMAALLDHGRIEDESILEVFALQMLEGLAYLHQSGFVHRDIKPANILLDENGRIKYTDFGAAMLTARRGRNSPIGNHRNPGIAGTPMYMSPELVRGHDGLDEEHLGAVDIWSFGCVLLEMATGYRPWANFDNQWAIMYQISQGNRPHIPPVPALPPLLVDFLNCCFEVNPKLRPTATELLQHEWMLGIRDKVVAEPPTPGESVASGGSGTNSATQMTPSLQTAGNTSYMLGES